MKPKLIASYLILVVTGVFFGHLAANSEFFRGLLIVWSVALWMIFAIPWSLAVIRERARERARGDQGRR